MDSANHNALGVPRAQAVRNDFGEGTFRFTYLVQLPRDGGPSGAFPSLTSLRVVTVLAMTFDELLTSAQIDTNILALWLDGSRGKGRPTAQSDYDCTVIVRQEVASDYRARLGKKGNNLDCRVMTIDEFRVYADWDSAERYDRYNFSRLKVLIDKTGLIQALIDEKGRVPDDRVHAFVDASFDHAINQIYRALKCLRDGDAAAARLEAAEAVAPTLDALFALNAGRLRPYYKYLEWELAHYPLTNTPWSAEEVPLHMTAFLDPASAPLLGEMVMDLERFARAHGHAAIFDNWGDALRWMKSWTDRVSS